MNWRLLPSILCVVLIAGCRGDAPGDRSSGKAVQAGSVDALPRSQPAADSDASGRDLRAIRADTITLSQYTTFVRPLRRLNVLPKDPDDFTPYGTDMEPDTFSLLVDHERYVVDPHGKALRLSVAQSAQMFALPLDTGLHIERLGFMRFQTDPVLLYQQTDNEGASGWVARFDSAGLQLRWSVRVPGFNVGYALLDGSGLYVTCFGFVGKLDLATGTYIWRHDDLYKTEGFNFFERPQLRGDTVAIAANGGRMFLAERRTGRRIKP
jgi:hypothetical protein